MTPQDRSRLTLAGVAVACLLAAGAATAWAGYLESDYPGQRVQPTPSPSPSVAPTPTSVPRPRPTPRPRPQIENPTIRLIQRVSVAEPIPWGGLVLFPVVAPEAEPASRITSLAVALAKGWVTLAEEKRPIVGQATLVNNSDNLVLVLAGELIKGGQQHRSSQKDLLLMPRSTVTIDLYCVEQGRWAGGGKFESANALAPQSVRSGNVAGAPQAEVWAEVKRFNDAAGARTESGSLLAGLESDKVQRELANCRNVVLPKLPAGTVGLVAGRAGRVFAADVFVDKDLFDLYRQMLIDSYATQEVYHRLVQPADDAKAQERIKELQEQVDGQRGLLRIARMTPERAREVEADIAKREAEIAGLRRLAPRPPTQLQARDFLTDVLRADFAPMQTPGGGQLWRISGSATGQSLDYKGQTVHAALTGPTEVPVVRPRPDPPRFQPMPRPIE